MALQSTLGRENSQTNVFSCNCSFEHLGRYSSVAEAHLRRMFASKWPEAGEIFFLNILVIGVCLGGWGALHVRTIC